MVWWVEIGYPPFDLGRGGFPRTGQILKHYRERTLNGNGKVLTQADLAQHLDLTEQAVGNLESRDAGMDADRRRSLCKLLAIPPLLFGIVMLEELLKIREQQKEEVCWWVELGHPSFAPGTDGFFPRTGEVVKYYRERKMDDKGKAWTQEALARVLGISEQAVRDIENKDAGMDHDRRHFLSRVFGIPPILFGIVTVAEIIEMVEQQKEKTAGPVFSPSLWTPHKAIIDTTEYRERLGTYWGAHHSHVAHRSITDSLLRIDTLYREFPRVRTEEWPQLQKLLCDYHQFVGNLLRDHQDYNTAIEHLEKAYRMAQTLKNNELKVLVLHRKGLALEGVIVSHGLNANRINDAVCIYTEARQYEKALPDNLRGEMLLEAGLVGAMAAQTDKDRKAAIALCDIAGSIARTGKKEEDPHFLRFNSDRYHLIRGAALIAVGWNKDALNELNLVRGGSGYQRRQAYNNILQAQAYANLGEYSEAASLAECGLMVVQEIDSKVNIARVESIHRQLQESPFRNNPEVARLDYLLFRR